jgi:flagellar protein FliJ
VTGLSFRFRLERVRALHERKEDLAKQELARAMSRRSDSEQRLRTVDAHIEQTHADQRSLAGAAVTVSAAELLARQAFLERVQTQRSVSANELQRSQADVADRDAELHDAARELEMFERLKQRQREQHDLESRRQETSALDEIALNRFRASTA